MAAPKRKLQAGQQACRSYTDLVMEAWDRLHPEDAVAVDDAERDRLTAHQRAMHRLDSKARL